MKNENFDVVVIGAGVGGPAAGAILAVLGEKTAGSFMRKYADEIACMKRYLFPSLY